MARPTVFPPQVRMGIATRNTRRAVDAFLKAADLPGDTFEPVLTRESPFADKPDPALALAACSEWGLSPAECLMVGDTMDDMRCGATAGCDTCLLQAPSSAQLSGGTEYTDGSAGMVGFKITSLCELTEKLDDAFDAS